MTTEFREGALHPMVAASLTVLGVNYEIVPCDPAFADTAEFCQKYGYPMETSANTIIVASTRGAKTHCACLVQASKRLDVNHTVKGLMGVSKASFATAAETKDLTGMEIGGVTVFGLPKDIPLYVDAAMMDQPYLIVGAGSRTAKVRIAPAELGKIPNCTVIEGLSLA
ncbi:MAG: hypothetical protein OXN15_01005 [Chloroflexota bacterium]|nr:hypothetical protein [Chloroflexota bacterium]MDE2969466.1 hypothetical protein [Chloroflexota bacterium]